MSTQGVRTVYLDNAATTWPKPQPVRRAVAQAFISYGANPGRGGHRMSMAASEMIFETREIAADFFGLDNPAGVIFTQNCTMALNIAIKGVLGEEGRAVISDLEHNAVVRPVHALGGSRPRYDVAAVIPGDPEGTVDHFERCITPETRAVVCMHASNVFGTRLPIREIGEMAHRHGLVFIVDAAQTAGVIPIDMRRDNIDYLCVPGHKGLYGPMGTGMLLCAEGKMIPALMQGGTGSRSVELGQPEELPDRFESGTLNVPGICGLRSGLLFVKKEGVQEIARWEMSLARYAYDRLSAIKSVELYTERPELSFSAPLLSMNVRGVASEDAARKLGRAGIAVRAGLHCSPFAHRHFGTLETGTVRLSFSSFSRMQDVDAFCREIRRIS